jgi:hypothetical protein
MAMTQNSTLLSNEYVALMNFYDGLGVSKKKKTPQDPVRDLFFISC